MLSSQRVSAQARTTASPSRAAALTGIGVVLIAFNLRAGISSTSALLSQLQAHLGFGPGVAALVSTLPTLCFAAVGACGAMAARRVGTERAVLLALLTLCAGLAVRAVPGAAALLAGTFLGAAGLALCNVLLPAVVRVHFPERIALLTGLYTTAVSIGSAVAAAAAVPVAAVLGDPSLGLAAWALPALVALSVWALRRDSWHTVAERTTARRVSALSMGRTRFGLLAAAFFALQCLNSYVVIGWLPSILTDTGMSTGRAGALLGLTLATGIPTSFALMPLCKSMPRLRTGFVLVGGALISGYLGLLYAPLAVSALWAALTGLGLGSFPLILVMIGSAGRNAEEAAALSTFIQSTGYLAASVGPFAVGLLRSATGDWHLPLVLLIVLALLQMVVGLLLTTTGARR
ncbi:MFS transporter [Streptomyces sioyaensis]|uniref:MFS transporter n=1 Tax=Streptomyces sioyaensis TaxID=67364 RepID=UPI0037D5B793